MKAFPSTNAARASLAALAILAAVPCSLAGTITETATRSLPAEQESAVTTLYVDSGRLRMDQKNGAGVPADSGLIFKDDRIYGLNHKKKTYTIIDRATVKVIADKLNAQFAQMEEQLERMEPQQRAMVEAAMGRGAGEKRAATSYEKTTRSEKAGGKSCRVWEGTRANDKIIEYCVVPFAQVPGGTELLATMKQLMGLMAEISAAISNSGMGASPLTTEWEGVQSIDGFPVLTRVFEDGQPASETVLKSARSAAVPATQFDVPAGYAEEKMAGVQ